MAAIGAGLLGLLLGGAEVGATCAVLGLAVARALRFARAVAR
jgi:hypothetical protein